MRLALPPGVVVPRSPLVPSTSAAAAAAEPSLVENARLRGKTPAVTPPHQQPLYSKHEPNGKAVAADVKPAGYPLVLANPESSSGKEQPGGNSNSHNNLDKASQRQSPDELAGFEMLVLKQPEAWSDVPDEEWLFAGGGRPLGLSHPKPKAEVARGAVVAASESSSVQVWAEAVFLPSCEIYALPYVVPY